MSARKPEEIKELVDLCVDEICNGAPIIQTLEKHNVHRASFQKYAMEVPFYREKLARAQELRAEIGVQEMQTIADDEQRNPNQVRNMIDVRKWTAERVLRKKYGQSIDVNVATQPDLIAALAGLHERTKEVFSIPMTQLVESTDTLQHTALDDKSNVDRDSEEAALKYILDLED